MVPGTTPQPVEEAARERTDAMSVPGAATSGFVRPSAAGPRAENAASPGGAPSGDVEMRSEEMGSVGKWVGHCAL